MNREVRLGSAAGLTIAATPSALLGSVALWGLLYAVATRLFRMPAWQAATGSLAAVALHWASVLAHHAGHAAAAWTTGHPMTGVRLFGVLGSSLYPSDEPALPASLHARRALGGPVASLAVGGVVSALWRPLGIRAGLPTRTRVPRRLGTGTRVRVGSPAPTATERRGAQLQSSPAPSATVPSPEQSVVTLLANFVLLDNLIVLGLSSFLPLGFTDGSTLLRLWRERAG